MKADRDFKCNSCQAMTIRECHPIEVLNIEQESTCDNCGVVGSLVFVAHKPKNVFSGSAPFAGEYITAAKLPTDFKYMMNRIAKSNRGSKMPRF